MEGPSVAWCTARLAFAAAVEAAAAPHEPLHIDMWEWAGESLAQHFAFARRDGLPDPFEHLYGADGPPGRAADHEAVFKALKCRGFYFDLQCGPPDCEAARQWAELSAAQKQLGLDAANGYKDKRDRVEAYQIDIERQLAEAHGAELLVLASVAPLLAPDACAGGAAEVEQVRADVARALSAPPAGAVGDGGSGGGEDLAWQPVAASLLALLQRAAGAAASGSRPSARARTARRALLRSPGRARRVAPAPAPRSPPSTPRAPRSSES